MAALEAGIDKLFPDGREVRTLCAEQVYALCACDLRV